MASELKVDKFTGVTTAGSILVTGEGNSTTTSLQQGLAKVWINFDGQSTIATRDSHNVSGISDEDKEEVVTNTLANQLHIVLRDNPWLLKFIQESIDLNLLIQRYSLTKMN